MPEALEFQVFCFKSRFKSSPQLTSAYVPHPADNHGQLTSIILDLAQRYNASMSGHSRDTLKLRTNGVNASQGALESHLVYRFTVNASEESLDPLVEEVVYVTVDRVFEGRHSTA